MKKALTPAVRKYIYGVANAVLMLAIGYQVITGEMAALWLVLINAVLGLALVNVNENELES